MNEYQPHAETRAESGREAVGLALSSDATAYLRKIYTLLAASLMVAFATGYVGMRLPFAFEHPFILMFAGLGVIFLSYKVQKPWVLFLFTAINGLWMGPLIAIYVGMGMSAIVGQAALMTGGAFVALTMVALTTRKDFSMMGGLLFAGLIVILIGGVINIFFHSTALSFAMSAAGAVIFSGYILYETQQYKREPWAVAPSIAALSMYLNIINLFLSLLRLLSILSGED